VGSGLDCDGQRTVGMVQVDEELELDVMDFAESESKGHCLQD
jgi:hypothetical protein